MVYVPIVKKNYASTKKILNRNVVQKACQQNIVGKLFAWLLIPYF